MYRGMMLAALLVMAGAAAAEERGTRVDLDSQFTAQRDAILAELKDGETFVEIEPGERTQVVAALDRMTAAVEQAGGVANLGDAQQVAMFNDQELVNTILTKAGDDSRLICKRERKTGSHRMVNHCMTVAERREAEKTAHDVLRKIRPGILETQG